MAQDIQTIASLETIPNPLGLGSLSLGGVFHIRENEQ